MERQLSPIAKRSQTRGIVVGILAFLIILFGFQWNFFLSLFLSVVIYCIVTFGSMYLTYVKAAAELTKVYKPEVTRVKNLYDDKEYIVATEQDEKNKGIWRTLVALDRGKQTTDFPALLAVTKQGQKIDAIDQSRNMQTAHLTENQKYTPQDMHNIIEQFIETHRQDEWTDVCGVFWEK